MNINIRFEAKNVYTRWDDSLTGKYVVYADSFEDLRSRVNGVMGILTSPIGSIKGQSDSAEYPFAIGNSYYKVVYYSESIDRLARLIDGNTVEVLASEILNSHQPEAFELLDKLRDEIPETLTDWVKARFSTQSDLREAPQDTASEAVSQLMERGDIDSLMSNTSYIQADSIEDVARGMVQNGDLDGEVIERAKNLDYSDKVSLLKDLLDEVI